jgi:dihydrofolate synthase/folylpolyglutamate synthase
MIDLENWLFSKTSSFPKPQKNPYFESALRALQIQSAAESSVVIGGTNGKGSVAKVLAHLLTLEGLSTGLYTSPHLVSVRERIQVDGEIIPEMEFRESLERLMRLKDFSMLSFFDIMTLLAADHFDSRTQKKIWEVGLGGLNDPTNSIPHAYSIITGIEADHLELLGASIHERAAHKFGILPPSGCAVVGPLHSSLEPTLDGESSRKNVKIIRVETPILSDHFAPGDPVPQTEIHSQYGKFISPFRGAMALNVMMSLQMFDEMGYDPRPHLSSIQNIEWAGRFSKISSQSKAHVYFSGDHNIHGWHHLVELLLKSRYRRLWVLSGVLDRKPELELLSELARLPHCEVFHWKFSNPEALENIEASVFERYLRICEAAGEEDLIVVTGSLYFVGAFYKFLKLDPM